MSSSSWSALLGCSLVAFTVIACGDSWEGDCEPLPLPELGTGYMDKQLFEGSWQHMATLLDAPAAAGLPLGAATEPILVRWVIFEDRLAAEVAFGPVLTLPIVRHVDDPSYTGAPISPVCAPLERPWYERTLAQVDWRVDLAATPDALAFVPRSSEVEPLSAHVRVPTVSVSEERSVPASIGFRMSYRVTADCERCEAANILVEHRFIRRFDLEDAP